MHSFRLVVLVSSTICGNCFARFSPCLALKFASIKYLMAKTRNGSRVRRRVGEGVHKLPAGHQLHTKFLIKHPVAARICIHIQHPVSSSCDSAGGAFGAALAAPAPTPASASAAVAVASAKNAINVKCASKLCAK